MIPSLTYNKLSDAERIHYIKKYHIDGDNSINELSKIWSTYPNKIIRDCKRLGLEHRNRSEAQIMSLKTGKKAHPTKGKERSSEEKMKIGTSKRQHWKSLSKKEKEKISKQRKKTFKGIGNQDLRVRNYKKAAVEGSKLEKFLHQALTDLGYYVLPHAEILYKNDKFHIDLLLPKNKIAIEVDGPTHFENIWGEDKLLSVKEKDSRKTSLVVEQGMVMIRIVNDMDFTESFARDVLEKLIPFVEDFQNIKKNVIIIKV